MIISNCSINYISIDRREHMSYRGMVGCGFFVKLENSYWTHQTSTSPNHMVDRVMHGMHRILMRFQYSNSNLMSHHHSSANPDPGSSTITRKYLHPSKHLMQFIFYASIPIELLVQRFVSASARFDEKTSFKCSCAFRSLEKSFDFD